MAVTPVRTGPSPTLSFPLAGDERGVSDFDALDVGDGVVGAGSAIEGDAEIAGAGLGLGGRTRREAKRKIDRDGEKGEGEIAS